MDDASGVSILDGRAWADSAVQPPVALERVLRSGRRAEITQARVGQQHAPGVQMVGHRSSGRRLADMRRSPPIKGAQQISAGHWTKAPKGWPPMMKLEAIYWAWTRSDRRDEGRSGCCEDQGSGGRRG